MNGDELADTLVLSRIHYPLLIGALLTNKRIRDKRGIVWTYRERRDFKSNCSDLAIGDYADWLV